MRGLPAGWIWTTLGKCFRWRSGGTPRRTIAEYYDGGIPWAVIGDLNDGLVTDTQTSISEDGLTKSSAKWAATGSVLLAMYGSIGKLGIAGQALTTNQAIAHTHPGPLPARYLFWYLRSIRSELMGLGKGGTQKNISQTVIKAVAFPLAPLREQHRIVAKIESLFARLDEGVAALKRAEANLERYRASVLKAAVEGRLTKRWRSENPPEETGEELLRRILSERRKRWEAEQLAKFEAKGRKPPKNWKAKYKEPATLDTSGLPGLPEGWCWATVDQVSVQMRNGRSVRTRAGGFPVLRLSAITGAVLDDRDTKEGDWGPEEAEPFRVRQGDFFVSRGNGSLDLVGRASFADDQLGEVAFPDTMIRVTFACRQLVRARFVAAIWNSQFIRSQIAKCAKTSAGIYKINQMDLRGVIVPVPPVEEQDLITGSHREFESARSHLANQITGWRHRASALRQSILKQAFEGRLVPQDSNDEPASGLLRRIRAERKAAQTTTIHNDQLPESPMIPRASNSTWGGHSL